MGLADVLTGDIDPLQLEVITRLFSNVARDYQALTDLTLELRPDLRSYLKRGIPLVLGLDDFDGELKANLASVIAQVGEPEDIVDLHALIQADIKRVKKGRAAWSRDDRGQLGNGGMRSYARWHVQAIVQLDPAGADRLLITLLSEPEYECAVAEEMARLASPKHSETPLLHTDHYRYVWEARAGCISSGLDEEHRRRYADALRDQITRLTKERGDTEQSQAFDHRLKELAKALAFVDPHESADLVLEVVAGPGEWDGWHRIDAAERLLFGGVVLPARPTLDLLDPLLERAEEYGFQGEDRWLLKRFLCICAFVDPPEQGIQKIHEITAEQMIHPYELREIMIALGHSRCEEALDLLRELASDQQLLEELDDTWTNAVASIGGPGAKDLLLNFIDPALGPVPGEHQLDQDVLATRIADFVRDEPEVHDRLLELCNARLSLPKRLLLARVIGKLGTQEAITAGLSLIDDAAQPPVPWGLWEHVEASFIERVPYSQSENIYTLAARPANSIREKLFEMATKDERRKKSAFSLLGQIEEWRLEYGRPTGEPRHPAFESGEPWPATDVYL